MRVAFAGSPAPAATVLRALAASAAHEVRVVISQPDRPRGRGGKVVPTPVSIEAEHLGIDLWRPASINDSATLDGLDALDVGAVCVVGFGQILRDRLLASWPCINVHFSVLPAYRGAAPVERALMDGCTETGVTIMQMDAGLDTGPIISIGRVRIGDEEDAGSLLARLADRGADLLIQALGDLEDGRLAMSPQPEIGVSLAPKITEADTALDLTRPARDVANRVRALSPHIGAGLVVDGQRFKIWRARPADAPAPPAGALWADAGRLYAPCGDGALEIVELQPPNRSRMEASAFLRGWRGGFGLANT